MTPSSSAVTRRGWPTSTNHAEIVSWGSSKASVRVAPVWGPKPVTASRVSMPGVPNASGRITVGATEVK